MKDSTKFGILQAALQISGLLLIGFFSEWPVALGVFLCFFGHNVEKHNERGKYHGTR